MGGVYSVYFFIHCKLFLYTSHLYSKSLYEIVSKILYTATLHKVLYRRWGKRRAAGRDGAGAVSVRPGVQLPPSGSGRAGADPHLAL